MVSEAVVKSIRTRYELIRYALNERTRRVWAGAEAKAVEHGGVRAVAQATGLDEATVRVGRREVEQQSRPSAESSESERIRRPGGGRKRLTETDPGLREALDALVEPSTRGDPMSPLRWSCKSTRKLAEELTQQGHPVSHRVVGKLLDEMGYRLQANRKTTEGSNHADRDAQFQFIADQVQEFQSRAQPVISVDTKKKELIGDFANGGREWQPAGHPEKVRMHDFPDKQLGKVIPYGVYDLTQNEGWVSVGIDHDTAQFAVASIGQWWRQMGRQRYPEAQELLITADNGGSNGSTSRLWKGELQQLAEQSGLRIRVCHFPPGTSKWNKIEHRMFSHISANWRGRPLTSHEVVVNLIASTTTEPGLRVKAALDTAKYPTGLKVSDDQLEAVNITKANFREEWNYTIQPKSINNAVI